MNQARALCPIARLHRGPIALNDSFGGIIVRLAKRGHNQAGADESGDPECDAMIHNLTLTKSSGLDLSPIHGWSRGHGLFQLRDDFLSEPGVIGFDGEASGVGVSAAAEGFGDAGDVDAVFR